MTSTEARPVVVRDVFPAEVVHGEDLYRPVRVLITRDHVYLFEARDGRPALLWSSPWTREGSEVPDVNAPKAMGSHLVLADGTVIHVNTQRHCGCGNPLKAAPLSVLLTGASRGRLG